jgi:hypothetical protein
MGWRVGYDRTSTFVPDLENMTQLRGTSVSEATKLPTTK